MITLRKRKVSQLHSAGNVKRAKEFIESAETTQEVEEG